MLSCVEHEKSFITSGPDCVDAQAYWSLLCANMPEGPFSHAVAQLVHV